MAVQAKLVNKYSLIHRCEFGIIDVVGRFFVFIFKRSNIEVAFLGSILNLKFCVCFLVNFF